MVALVVPGVRVEARFDVLPPLPAASGIVGVVGIVDRPSAGGALVPVSKVSELLDLLGPGTSASMPEAVHALANGAVEAVIAPVLGGSPASVDLLNTNAEACVRLRARSNGAWANALTAEIRGIANAAGEIVRITLRILQNGSVVETWPDLQVIPGQPDDLFEALNSRSRYVVALDPGFITAVPAAATHTFDAQGTPIAVKENGGVRDLMRLSPASDADPDGLAVNISVNAQDKIRIRVFQGGLKEEFNDLVMNPDDTNYLPYVLLTQSRLIRLQPLTSLARDGRLPVATGTPLAFTGGVSPSVSDYRDAIDRLSDDTRIDAIVASIEPARSVSEVHTIHQALTAHAVAMADAGAPRIAFGAIAASEKDDIGKIRDHAAAVRNRRFVLVAPPQAAGAVAGLVGRLNPQDSPTFKPLPLHGLAPARFRESELSRLLGATTNALVVQNRAGRGVVVLKGIDTTGDQISVTRVADQAIRETKAISENFIGRLNSQDARTALKQQLVATFLRMERDGALVPSTDGADPAFMVDVYSTQQDFAQGIVRVDIAVRPVRAIDYIYATIRVKN